MSKPIPSPALASAIEGFVTALHAAYPDIATHGVRPKQPGLFIGEVGGELVQLIPRKRWPRLCLMSTPGRRPETRYLRFVFDLQKRGIQYNWGHNDEEMILLVWLTNATAELKALIGQ